jgi:hypothetical protein
VTSYLSYLPDIKKNPKVMGDDLFMPAEQV